MDDGTQTTVASYHTPRAASSSQLLGNFDPGLGFFQEGSSNLSSSSLPGIVLGSEDDRTTVAPGEDGGEDSLLFAAEDDTAAAAASAAAGGIVLRLDGDEEKSQGFVPPPATPTFSLARPRKVGLSKSSLQSSSGRASHSPHAQGVAAAGMTPKTQPQERQQKNQPETHAKEATTAGSSPWQLYAFARTDRALYSASPLKRKL